MSPVVAEPQWNNFQIKAVQCLDGAAQWRYVAYNRCVAVGYSEGGSVKDNLYIKIKNP